VEDRAQVVQAAFRRAVALLKGEQGEDPARWRWGRIHDLHIKHVMGSERIIAGFFNLPRIEAPGALDSVWKSHFDLSHPVTPFRAMAGPAFRMIVDLGDIEHGWWVIETGISGWPGSPHYGDQHKLWKDLKYLPMMSDWVQIRARAVAVLTLR
jgi:penicillin amidase